MKMDAVWKQTPLALTGAASNGKRSFDRSARALRLWSYVGRMRGGSGCGLSGSTPGRWRGFTFAMDLLVFSFLLAAFFFFIIASKLSRIVDVAIA